MECTSYVLDWNKPETFPEKKFDVIVGSDVLFLSRNAESVAEVLKRNMNEGGLAIIFCPGRGYVQRLFDLIYDVEDLKPEAHFLYDQQFKYCKMSELHILVVRKGNLTRDTLSIFESLNNFVISHS